MKNIFFAVLICLLMNRAAYAAETGAATPHDQEQVILRLLSNDIFDAIGNYYGEPRLYWDGSDRVLSVRPLPDTRAYEVVVQVETFCGPHNPPYGVETMTFLIDGGGVTLATFEHRLKN